MPRLPDMESLGARPVPTSRRQIASNPAAGVVGRAVEGLGDTVAQIGNQKLEAQDRLEQGAAAADYLKRDTDVRAALQDDPDYSTYEARYTEQMKTAREASGALIANSNARAQFEQGAALDLERGRADVLQAAHAKQKVAEKGALLTGLNNVRLANRVALDEPTRSAGIKAAGDLIAGATAKGVIDPLEAEQISKSTVSTLVSDQATMALDHDDPVAAKSIIDKYGNLLDGDTWLKLQDRLKSVADFHQSFDDATRSRTMGTGPVAAPPAATQAPPVAQMISALRGQESGGHQFNASGQPLTSPKGAIGVMQVMPGTGPEAASLAGLPWDASRLAKDPAYNQALGEAYFKDLLRQFRDPIAAAAAYNAGPGSATKGTGVRGAMAKAQAAGHPERWTSYLPVETQKYIVNFQKNTGATSAAQALTGADRSTAYQNLDKIATDENWTLERHQRAAAALDQQLAREDHARQETAREAQQQHAAWLNDFEVKLHDGTAGPADIQAARSSGRLTDYDEINRAESIVAERDKQSADINTYNTMISTPGFTFNPYDDQQKKGVEAAVKSMGGSPQAAFDVWQRTGILAKSGAVALRGGLVSADPTHVAAAANVAANMVRRNPNAFAGVDGGEDMERAAFAFNHYTYDLGYSPAQASARIAKENSPDFKAKVKLGQPEIAAYRKQLHDTGGDDAVSALGANFQSPDRRAEANQSYAELTVENMQKGYDMATAQGIAARQLHKIYAVSRDGLLHKFAPEGGYPPINGSFNYIYRDAADTVKAETGHEVDPALVRLIPIPGVTDDDFRNGRPARYRILYGYHKGGQLVQDVVHGEFAADVHAAAATTTAKRAESFGEKQIRLRALQAEQDRIAAMPINARHGAGY